MGIAEVGTFRAVRFKIVVLPVDARVGPGGPGWCAGVWTALAVRITPPRDTALHAAGNGCILTHILHFRFLIADLPADACSLSVLLRRRSLVDNTDLPCRRWC